jgi:Fe-S cluster biogenesis protein NfuA
MSNTNTVATEKSELEQTLHERVEAALDKVRPTLQRDGGDIELLDVVDGVAKVRLQGACAGCPMSQMTLTWGVEQTLVKEVPEILRVETDTPLPSFGGLPFNRQPGK